MSGHSKPAIKSRLIAGDLGPQFDSFDLCLLRLGTGRLRRRLHRGSAERSGTLAEGWMDRECRPRRWSPSRPEGLEQGSHRLRRGCFVFRLPGRQIWAVPSNRLFVTGIAASPLLPKRTQSSCPVSWASRASRVEYYAMASLLRHHGKEPYSSTQNIPSQ